MVVLSYFIAAIASILAIYLADLTPQFQLRRDQKIALLSGATVLGAAVWSMHFLGMLAFELCVTVKYDPLITLLSIWPAFVASWAAMRWISRAEKGVKHLWLSGMIIGLGIGIMHYSGMLAIRTAATMTFKPWWVLISVVAAVLLAVLALWFGQQCERLQRLRAWRHVVSGLVMGAVDGLSPAGGASLRVPRWAVLSFTALLAALFVGVNADYLKAEENYRTLRMESARIGAAGIVTPAPELRLLTQLGAFLQFARTEATPGMAPEQVDWMRKVSERFGYPPVMFRYALAAGLNGQPEVAQQTLARLCRIHEPQRCVEAHEGWAGLQVRYPQLPPFANGKLGTDSN